MDKFEYKVRADEIKELISEGNYAEAAEIADSIDWRRVKSVMMLCMISDLYKINKRYEDAKNMLLLAYERRPGGRTICYSLCELCLKTQEFVQAVNYYKEFIQVAPNDSGRFILQYKILEAQDVGLEERIQVLQELKAADYREKWAYELAYLYHRTGQATRCVDECDQLILWFGDGKYVIKAMELKMQHRALTPEQQEKYDHRFDKPVRAAASEPVQAAEGNAESGVEASALPKVQQEPAIESVPAEQENIAETAVPAETTVFSREQVTALERAVEPQEAVPAEQEQAEEPEIHVKTMDVGEYNTINLQAELAAGLQAILGEEKATRAIVAPLLQGEEEAAPEVVNTTAGEEIEETEVFFGETGEISRIQPELKIPMDTQDVKEVTVEEIPEETPDEVSGEASEEVAEEKEVAEVEAVTAEAGEASVDTSEEQGETAETKQDSAQDVTAQIVMEQMRLEGMATSEQQALAVEPPKALAGVLSQESDGQIRLVIPERESVEKQITGQMNIDDILAEWERMKKESEEKRKEEVRQHVLQQTGNMFTEFEASIRDGLLEKLESGEADSVDELLAALEEPSEVEESVEETDEPVEAAYATPELNAAEELELSEEEASAEVREEESAEEDIGEVEELPETENGVEEVVPETKVEDEEQPEETEAEPSEEMTEEEESEEDIEEPADELSEEEAEAEEQSDEFSEDEAEAEEPAGELSEDEAEVEESAEELPAEGAEAEMFAEQDAPKVRALTREERELYAPFIQGRTARERLVKAIDAISMAAYTGNIIITGEEGMDTMLLAKNMMREIQMSDSNFSGKVAKVSGESLNQRDVESTIKQLCNGALIIQRASGMNGETANRLHKLLQQENFGIIVVLEDTKKGISQLFASNPKLSASFTARMDVEALSNDSLVAFGKKYAREMEFSIDEMGILALHTRIEELQTIDHAVTVMEVKEIVDEAIHNAKRKTFKHFMDVLFAKRYDDEDMIILTEKDFA